METYNKMKTPPKNALKRITGGRLSGMTDINPQWRIEIMTETYGECGVGWYYTVENREFIPGADGVVVVFVDILLYHLQKNGTWSKGIPGNGGSTFVAKETNRYFTSDEAVKMATTDALSVAMKFLGVGADIYRGVTNSKYTQDTKDDNGVPPENNIKLPKLTKTTKTKSGHNAFDAAEKFMKDGGDIEDITSRYEVDDETIKYLLSLKP
jgi:hypothetical protein